VPSLDVEPCKLLQHLGTEEGYDLMLGELAVALRRAGGDAIRFRLPLVYTPSDEVRYGDLARLDVGAGAHRSDQLGKFDLRLALSAFERLIRDLALTGSVAA